MYRKFTEEEGYDLEEAEKREIPSREERGHFWKGKRDDWLTCHVTGAEL